MAETPGPTVTLASVLFIPCGFGVLGQGCWFFKAAEGETDAKWHFQGCGANSKEN